MPYLDLLKRNAARICAGPARACLKFGSIDWSRERQRREKAERQYLAMRLCTCLFDPVVQVSLYCA